MNSVTPYLFFVGKCREALNFYKKVFGGELTLMTYGEAQGDACPKGAKDRIIHGALKNQNMMLMASDTPDDDLKAGNSVQLSLACESVEQLESIYKALAENGESLYPPHDAFWGDRFGMCIDRFGMYWMLNSPLKKK